MPHFQFFLRFLIRLYLYVDLAEARVDRLYEMDLSLSKARLRPGVTKLPPEPQTGNIEYKYRLCCVSEKRLEQLITQMKWRLDEGCGRAFYEIGVGDDGTLRGLSLDELNASLDTVRSMARENNCKAAVAIRLPVGTGFVAEVSVSKLPDDSEYTSVRVAIIGNSQSGKSTLLGVLTTAELDDGRGSARLNIFRHEHEIRSGQTSSVAHGIVRFDSNGAPIRSSCCGRLDVDVGLDCSNMVTLIDTPGHTKYLSTAFTGLRSGKVDHVLLVISSTAGIAGTTRELSAAALALGLPLFVVVTKTDDCTASRLTNTLSNITALFDSESPRRRIVFPGKQPIIYSPLTVPVFLTSSVTGLHIDTLIQFISTLKVPDTDKRGDFNQDVKSSHETIISTMIAKSSEGDLVEDGAPSADAMVEFQVEKVFTVDDAGPVVAGTLLRGCIAHGDDLSLGPGDDGTFFSVKVARIERHRIACSMLRAGSPGSIELFSPMGVSLKPRRGQYLFVPNCRPYLVTRVFLSQIRRIGCFEHDVPPRVMPEQLRATICIGATRQTGTLELTDTEAFWAGREISCIVDLRWRPELARHGDRFLFCSGRCIGVGSVLG